MTALSWLPSFDFLARAQELAEQIVGWRRDFHQHPELGFHEYRTAGIVADHLQAWGIETTTGVGQTGVVGLVDGGEPGPTVLLRFDMDALPIHEATGLPFASSHAGVMHACGHDGHTAIGLGAAKLLVESAHLWPGRVKLLFQPAEEGLGGALATVRDGVLENPVPEIAFGLHLWNQSPAGLVFAQPGPLMAAADRFAITLTGRGGHGGMPHTTIDAVLMAAQAIGALHTIVSRNVPAHETAVLSVGSVHAGEAFNVIAEEAVLTGTLRTFLPATRDLLIRRMHEVLAGVAAAYAGSYQMTFADHTPAVMNAAKAADLAARVAVGLVGSAQVQQMTPLMVAEDMAEILNRIPGCYLMLGAEPAGGAQGAHHNPRFDFDETMLPVGAALLASLAVAALISSVTGQTL